MRVARSADQVAPDLPVFAFVEESSSQPPPLAILADRGFVDGKATPVAELKLSADKVFDKSREIDHRTIAGEAFIITAHNSRIHNLNEVGSFVFDLCDGRTPVSAIINRVTDEFDVEPARAQEDVLKFLTLLLEQKMLVLPEQTV